MVYVSPGLDTRRALETAAEAHQQCSRHSLASIWNVPVPSEMVSAEIICQGGDTATRTESTVLMYRLSTHSVQTQYTLQSFGRAALVIYYHCRVYM